MTDTFLENAEEFESNNYEQTEDTIVVKESETTRISFNTPSHQNNSDIQPNYRFYEDPLPGWEIEDTQSTIRTPGK
ncbi:MAG: hypothetical protein EOL97_16850 [Spirochaetia bacterium]|nr:hypothetical protein [Spirochaetia bacterium]